ncbi:MAG: helix-hairpin-helix domain-containing protein [Bacteroidales bacterium]|nr:helix-hairpin-helix domain-containing protein [Bacteroidales bacterium]
MKQKERDGRKKRATEGAAGGAVALVFLIIGFQLAIFVTKVVERPATPQPSDARTARIFSSEQGETPEAHSATPQPSGAYEARIFSSERSKTPEARRRETSEARRSKLGGYKTQEARRSKIESFVFNPNTVTHDELVRLGLSERQAEVIEHYREKGGQFRSKADFAKMYVVSDSLYERLERFIEIPRLELNSADSSALVELRGIGPYYARKILSYRDSLGGYYEPEQLLEIRGIDSQRFAGLSENIFVDSSRIRPLRIWDISEDSLARHPYVGRQRAQSIARYRRVYAMEPLRKEHYTLESLVQESILTPELALKLRPYCRE